MSDNGNGESRYYVILKNDDVHTFSEVIRILERVPGKSHVSATNVAIAAHTLQFAAVYRGDLAGANVLHAALTKLSQDYERLADHCIESEDSKKFIKAIRHFRTGDRQLEKLRKLL
ncbi:MAG: hypothetical protein A3G34_10395 [Candidatus Lindowbacteria bacterium RIFCSPLOWO2_12_FULL_62_27]|nr:MAG: hypothetical protein A3G34_10395 [Candidatus Lindowbacteria bacterium RIFCSPLOWO2_12_FULL_62_27]OGH63485.1 MAG: hypothetical protein A3I06_12150 [Candidatus Lindowbacteria bacterium RIFCSPLOWO2_02_FULL_62_12]